MADSSPSLQIPHSLPTRRKVLSMRYMGYEAEEIAAILSMSVGSVQHHINAAVAASSNSERITIVREAEITKLEELENAFAPAALGEVEDPETGGTLPPSSSAAKVVLDVMDRRAKLMGIDKAQPQTSIGNLTLIQILSQMPAPPGANLGAATTPAPLFSREATDA